jgi:hypothetical protein
MLPNPFGRHQPDPLRQWWDDGLFVTAYLVCSRPMIKPVNGVWQLVGSEARR